MLYAAPVTVKQTKEFIKRHHRHHRPSLGAVFVVGCCDETGKIRGVAMVGRPVARRLCDGKTLEITRVATDGVRNGCSFLIGICRRVAFNLGYRRLVTYTLPAEGGASLRASNWTNDITTPGRSWNVPSRKREDLAPLGEKFRWTIENKKAFPGPFVFPLEEENESALKLFGGM